MPNPPLSPEQKLGLALATRWPNADDRARQRRGAIIGWLWIFGFVGVAWLKPSWIGPCLLGGFAYWVGHYRGIRAGYVLCYKFKTGGLSAMLQEEMETIFQIETPEMVESCQSAVHASGRAEN